MPGPGQDPGGEGEQRMATRLPRRTKLLYGSGDIGFSLTTTIIGAFLAIYLTDVVGLSPGAAGTAIFIGGTWDYVNDPLMGYLSDRTRTRWGRRRPYLLFGALPFGLAFALLWWRPPLEPGLWLTAYYAAAYVVFDAAATLLYMPYFALTPELTSDYDERTSLTSYRMFFSILGSLLAFTIPWMVVGRFEPANQSRVLLMGALFAAASALPMFLVFAGTRERPIYMQQERPGLRQSLGVVRKNKPFVMGLLIFLATWISVVILQDNLAYYIKHVARRESQSELIMGSVFVTAIAVLPLWTWLSHRFSKRKAYMGGIAFWAGVQIVLVTVTAQTGLGVILLLCVLAGIGVSAAHVLPWAMLPDAIEWGELQTGERHEGTFYSLVTLSRKVATSVAIPATLWLLHLTGYNGLAEQQPASALLGLRLVIGPMPALLLCLGIAAAWLYPLTRRRHAEVVQELEERRAAAAD
jgi:GPH family glycoside/pentoside/hexuronide:cation symporter